MKPINIKGLGRLRMDKVRVPKEYLKVAELSDYSGISQRTLRDFLKDPVNPIPHFRVGVAGRIIRIKKSEFDQWMESQRADQSDGIDELIAEVFK
jgi:excisionase family DNA binding protein